MISKYILIGCAALSLLGLGCNKQNQPTQSDQETIYTSADFHFQIYKPQDVTIAIVPVSVGVNDRVGQVNVTDNIIISVYKTKAGLEQDFSSALTRPEFAKNWHSITMSINGAPAQVYSTNDYVDGVGATAESAVLTEVIGPTYAYMIQFYGISDDPNNPEVATYLSSFKAS